MLLVSLQNLGCKMSITLHYLHGHLSEYLANLGNFSKEQEKHFHQDVRNKEEHYQCQWNCNMMADCSWSFRKDISYAVHERLANKIFVFALDYALLGSYNHADCCNAILLLLHVFFVWFWSKPANLIL